VTIGNEETVHDLFSVRNMFFVMLTVMPSFRAWWPVLKIELAPFGGAVATNAAEPAIPLALNPVLLCMRVRLHLLALPERKGNKAAKVSEDREPDQPVRNTH
jgi:hypothetical protein